MKDKIYEVMQKVVENPSNIDNIFQSNKEFFFTFKGIFLSILKSEGRQQLGHYSLYLYPRYSGSTHALAAKFDFPDQNDEAMISYHEGDADDEHNQDLFEQVYRVVETKYLNLDEIFDHLLED